MVVVFEENLFLFYFLRGGGSTVMRFDAFQLVSMSSLRDANIRWWWFRNKVDHIFDPLKNKFIGLILHVDLSFRHWDRVNFFLSLSSKLTLTLVKRNACEKMIWNE